MLIATHRSLPSDACVSVHGKILYSSTQGACLVMHVYLRMAGDCTAVGAGALCGSLPA